MQPFLVALKKRKEKSTQQVFLQLQDAKKDYFVYVKLREEF